MQEVWEPSSSRNKTPEQGLVPEQDSELALLMGVETASHPESGWGEEEEAF